MTGNTRNALTALTFVALMMSAAFAGPMVHPVSAQDGEDSVVDALFTDDEDGDGPDWAAVKSFASGLYERYSPLAEQPEESDASEYADRVQSTFNENASHVQNWTNTRVMADSEYDVIRFRFEDESGNTEWLFLVAEIPMNTEEYDNARMMNLTQFKQLDRDVDTTYRLSPYASRNANAELETFIREYAKPGEDLNQSYLARMAGEYRGEITGEDLPGGD